MRRVGRPLAALTAALVMGPALAACAEEAPTDAAPEDFCGAFRILADADSGADFREFGQQLERVGTPSDITNDGRAGFEVVVRVAQTLDEDATLEELEDPNVSSREAQQATEFLDYGSTTCRALDREAGGI